MGPGSNDETVLRVVIAPDAFKGGPSAKEVAVALAEGWRAERPFDALTLMPLADGGEGTLEAIAAASSGAIWRTVFPVSGPDGRPIESAYLWLPDGTAVVELARASGLPLMERPDALGAHTRGLGEVMRAALAASATRLVVGLGGSASTDGGTGALTALGCEFLDRAGVPLPLGGGSLEAMASVRSRGRVPLPARGIEVLTDVTNPLLGPKGAAAAFGPQKGASPDDVARLERGLRQLATLLGGSIDVAGAGAAGGTGFGFAELLDAKLVSGSQRIAELLGLEAEVRAANVVLTAEGRFDATSHAGKAPSAVLALAARAGVAAAVIAGEIDLSAGRGGWTPISLSELAGSRERSIAEPRRWLKEAGRALARDFARRPPPPLGTTESL